ncbi:hypothetical protein OAO48_03615 [Alphaproteobacteria bacterium]|jgi:hypothetical protein|nr:hypothetical protein [Alphaproteobacteria bacterium]
MSNTNYVIMTVASVDFSYRETMAKLMSSYSKDLIAKAGAKGTRFGSIGTGEHAGSLLFVQFYDDLNGYQKGLELQGNSSQFKEIMSSGKANIYLRNIATSLQTKFEQSSEHPKYIVMTRAEASMSDKEKFLDCVNDTSSCFKDNGALTLRFGNLLTGSNVGNYLLGVGYPSMEAIEKTYDELSANSSYKKLMTFAKVNMRNIIKIL